MKKILTAVSLTLTLALGSFTSVYATPAVDKKVAVAPTALVKNDVKVGKGAEAKEGQTVAVHYTGWLFDAKASDFHGKQFDSSRTRGTPFKFPLGAGRVIKGWDQGVQGMKVGGQRTLIIPAKLGYGERGAGGAIPPNAVLVFDVELIGVE